jgi:hypothetical protein
METFASKDPRAHTANVRKEFRELIEHLRGDIDKIDEPKAQALFAAVDGRSTVPPAGSKRSAPAPRAPAKAAAKPATKTAASRALTVPATGNVRSGRGSSARSDPG